MAAAMKSGNGGLDAAANWLTLGTSERQLATPSINCTDRAS